MAVQLVGDHRKPSSCLASEIYITCSTHIISSLTLSEVNIEMYTYLTFLTSGAPSVTQTISKDY